MIYNVRENDNRNAQILRILFNLQLSGGAQGFNDARTIESTCFVVYIKLQKLVYSITVR